MEAIDDAERRHASFVRDIRGVTLRLGALYWGATFIIDSIFWGVAGTDPLESALGKLFSCTMGALICFAIAALLFRFREASITVQAVLCFLVTLIAAPIFAGLDFAIYAFCMWPESVTFDSSIFGKTLVSFAANFFGWSCLFIALLYHFRMRDQERRLAASREEALAAQMRALRYQINPHFLFNTLNSITALIEENATGRAKQMIIALSDFLHETLRLDPMHDVRLTDEIALQVNYLSIERERFPGRISVDVAVPEELTGKMVPSLILQPLIENAIKHGLGAGPGPIAITIAAAASDGRLELSVENDMPGGPAPSDRKVHGLGIGLRNVAERIHARFDEYGSFSARHVTPTRFRAVLRIPLVPA
jgi:sensor histidine kinase YesM